MKKERTYHYMSMDTGEIVESFKDVVRVTIENLIHYRFLCFRWKRGNF